MLSIPCIESFSSSAYFKANQNGGIETCLVIHFLLLLTSYKTTYYILLYSNFNMKLTFLIVVQCLNLVLCKKSSSGGHCDKDGCSESLSCDRIMSKVSEYSSMTSHKYCMCVGGWVCVCVCNFHMGNWRIR